ncbi:MAG: hypothetical protein DCC49_09735 [Acidobacteria bacterium]|nr:MAG: hypothetical protein DCC49_09735 [Acidobacteriota bacterium]
MESGVVIPITGDAPLVGEVVRAAYRSRYVNTVVAVAHESARAGVAGHPTDRSGIAEAVHRAALAGAKVVYTDEAGRGPQVAKGIEAIDDDAIMLLDADLQGLITHHVDLLAWPLDEGHAAMACGLIDSGAVLNQVFRYWLPILTRQRCVKRELIEALDTNSIKAGNFESDLGHMVDRSSIPTHTVVLEGVWQSPTFTANARLGRVAGTFARMFQYAAYPFGVKLPSVPEVQLPGKKRKKGQAA